MMENQKQVNASLRGRTVKSVRLRRFATGMPAPANWATDPEIEFTDGTVLRFIVQETEVGDYGVELCIREVR